MNLQKHKLQSPVLCGVVKGENKPEAGENCSQESSVSGDITQSLLMKMGITFSFLKSCLQDDKYVVAQA